MTYCQVGKPNDARRLLGVADQFIAEEMPSFTDGKSSPYWPEWLRTQILRRELVALIAAGTDQN
jgi:hypothetical protein